MDLFISLWVAAALLVWCALEDEDRIESLERKVRDLESDRSASAANWRARR
jgi:hypothetical protein